jgi:hypothetical protein
MASGRSMTKKNRISIRIQIPTKMSWIRSGTLHSSGPVKTEAMPQKQDRNKKRKKTFFAFYLRGDYPHKGASSLPCPSPGKTTLNRQRSEFFDYTNNSTEIPNILDDSPRVQKQQPLFYYSSI